MNVAASDKTFFKTFAAIAVAISALAIYQTQVQTEALLKIRTRYKWVLLMVLFAANIVAGVIVFLRLDKSESWSRQGFGDSKTIVSRVIGWLLVILPLPVLWWARGQFFGRGLEAFFRLLWLFWWLGPVQATGLRLGARLSWPAALALALIVDGMLAEFYTLVLPISNYPFSMGWSEASRFYYGSLPFSNVIYGTRVPLSVWHGTRYFMLAIPFLIKGIPIWAARAWQVLLWLVVTGATGWTLVRRLRLSGWISPLLMLAWFFLYVFQGAVYYHLQVCVIIILLGVAPDHPWRTVLAVMASSFWAGMSRLNWYPVPAMLAITLYLLENPVSRFKSLWAYVRRPLLWAAVGAVAALLGQAFYIAISGNTNLEAFGSSLTSALLWYRWWPSATNPIGIVPGVLIVSIPLWLILFWKIRESWRTLHPLRWFGLFAMLIILLAGGLIVSTKIGGGGDLHNMDAYLVLLAVLGAYFAAARSAPEDGSAPSAGNVPWLATCLLILIPVAFSILRIGEPFAYDPQKAAADVSTLRGEVQTYSQSGEVLFMYERQLLTFGMIPHVQLVPEDEVVSLMEMAISGNKPYLSQFYADLASHRFAAIVAHPQNLGVETGDFIEESNTWNRLVAQPMLCQYKPALTLAYSKVQILVPRARPCAEFPPSFEGP